MVVAVARRSDQRHRLHALARPTRLPSQIPDPARHGRGRWVVLHGFCPPPTNPDLSSRSNRMRVGLAQVICGAMPVTQAAAAHTHLTVYNQYHSLPLLKCSAGGGGCLVYGERVRRNEVWCGYEGGHPYLSAIRDKQRPCQ